MAPRYEHSGEADLLRPEGTAVARGAYSLHLHEPATGRRRILTSWSGTIWSLTDSPLNVTPGEHRLRLESGAVGTVMVRSVSVHAGRRGVRERIAVIGSGPAPF